MAFSAALILLSSRLFISSASSFVVQIPTATRHVRRTIVDDLRVLVPPLHLSSSSRLDYVHGYHAGNNADVVKHSILILLLECMKRKDSPFVYVDTHAGAGSYPLDSREALQMKEFQGGIGKVLVAEKPLPGPLTKLVDMTKKEVGESSLIYPGSPMIAKELCRSQDTMLLFERAHDQFDRLCNVLKQQEVDTNDAHDRTTICMTDGYVGLAEYSRYTKQLPRALVFIDPPYQFGSDTDQIVRLVRHLQQHWKSARVAIWYPASDALKPKTERLLFELKAAVPGDVLAVEMYPSDAVGTGMVLANPPYGIEHDIERCMSLLGSILRDDRPTFRMKWL
ncbi:Methylates adenine of 23S rRNA [Fragilaria crotonensis]|nr:Methylates adenine of 23S rRNA [Fragilaria crotonensis]